MPQNELSQRHLDGYRRCAMCPRRRKRREYKPGLGFCEMHFKALPENEREKLLDSIATPPREKWEYEGREDELLAAQEQ